jgi:anti-sigma regulatory factor (Ser/Thr protein kinase)
VDRGGPGGIEKVLEELSDHLMDVAMNSVRAGARNIALSVIADGTGGRLTMSIADDGAGMTEETVRRVTDPFYSTKTERKVGLGVPLLKGIADLCSGEFHIRSAPGKGTEIKVAVPLDHPDLPPLGDVKETMLLLSVSNPGVRFSFRYDVNGREFLLDTGEIAKLLGEVPINHPEVIAFLKRYVKDQ